MNNKIIENYQLNSILDIYGGRDNGQTLNNAVEYYTNHNSIPNGVVVSNKLSPVNGMHKIANAYYYYDNNNYDTTNETLPYSKYYPLLLNEENNYAEKNNYKLISFKDIDFENAYLKYANQIHPYNDPITYYELGIDQNGTITKDEIINNKYSFGREITPYINNSYDFLNIIDYLLNRVNCLYFLLNIVKEQKNIAK